MKYLVSLTKEKFEQLSTGYPADFNWTNDGEILCLPFTCDNENCGCDRSFTGIDTAKGTTLGVVVHSGIDIVKLKNIFRLSQFVKSWRLPPGQLFQINMYSLILDIQEMEAGAILRIRSTPSGEYSLIKVAQLEGAL